MEDKQLVICVGNLLLDRVYRDMPVGAGANECPVWSDLYELLDGQFRVEGNCLEDAGVCSSYRFAAYIGRTIGSHEHGVGSEYRQDGVRIRRIERGLVGLQYILDPGLGCCSACIGFR